MRGIFVEAATTNGCNYNASYSNSDLISLSASNNEACSCVVTANSSLSLYLDIMVRDVQTDSAAVYWPVVKVMGIYMCARSNVSHSTMVHVATDEKLRLRLYGAQHIQVTVAVMFQGICCVIYIHRCLSLIGYGWYVARAIQLLRNIRGGGMHGLAA